MGANDERGHGIYATVTSTGLLKITKGAGEGATLMVGGRPKPVEKYEWEDAQKKKQWQWAFLFTSFTGNIIDIKFKEVEYEGKKFSVLDLVMNDKDETWTISMGAKSRHAYNFLEKAGNVDFSKPVTFNPWGFVKDGKLKQGVTLTQDGVKLESAFWKDNKRTDDFPQPNDVMDSDEWKHHFNVTVFKFLYAHLDKVIIPKMNSADLLSGVEVPEIPEYHDEKSDIPEPPVEDDLPF